MSQISIVAMPTYDHYSRPCSRFWRREPNLWALMGPSTMLEPFLNQVAVTPLDLLTSCKPKSMDRRDPMHGQVKMDDGHFHVSLDVKQFSPNELIVKTVDNAVVVHGKHEEKQDQHGYISREFTRRYILPEGVDADTVTSSLSQDGILLIEAPRKALEAPKANERIVPVIMSYNDKETPENNGPESLGNKDTVMESTTEE